MLKFALLIVLLAVLASGALAPKPTPEERAAREASEQARATEREALAARREAAEQAVLSEVKTWDVVKDALWKNGWLYVGVLDNGTPRDGLASALCSAIHEHPDTDPDNRYVKVIDIAHLVRTEEWKALATRRCKF